MSFRDAVQRNRLLIGWTVISFFAFAWMPLVNRSRNGDVSDWYSDHTHHPFATYVAMKKGLAIYTVPFSQIWDNSGYPHEAKAWGEMPGMAYPPGVFAVFLPTMLIGLSPSLSQHAFGVLNVLYMILLAHLSFFAVLLCLKSLPSGSRATVGLVCWMMLMALGSEGFYDTIFVGAGAMVVLSLAKEDPARALRWLGIGALLHFRMAAFAPLGIYAVYRIIRLRKERPLPWKSLAFALVAAVLCVWSFILMYPATAAFRQVHPPVLGGNALGVVVIVSVLAAVASAVFADLYVSAMVLVCLGLCLVERQNYWWHAAITLAPILSVGAVRQPRQASLIRAVLIGWSFALTPLVWRDSPAGLFTGLAQGLKL